MNNLNVVFSHGKESGPYGEKIKYLMQICRNNNIENIQSIDYTKTQDPDERVDILLEHTKDLKNVILVGSSMGGYVSIVGSEIIKPRGLFLLAPAVFMSGYKKQLIQPHCEICHIIYGYRDEVIPMRKVVHFAQHAKANLTILDSDHRLDNSIEYIGELFNLFLKKIK